MYITCIILQGLYSFICLVVRSGKATRYSGIELRNFYVYIGLAKGFKNEK